MTEYYIMSMFVVAYMATMWYVLWEDCPANYSNVKDFMRSKYYIFTTFLTVTVIGGLTVLYYDSEDWRYPLIAVVVICINNFIAGKYKKPRAKYKR